MYCKARLLVPCSALTLVWSPLERTDRYAELLGARPLSSIPAMVDLIKAGEKNVVYVPGPDRFAEQFDFFCRIAWECERARVLIEELSRVTYPSWAPPAWRNLSTAGAHQHLELIATAQAPSLIDKVFLNNCSEVRCYRLNSEDDARRMSKLLQVPYAELMDLPRFHYRHRVFEARRTVPGVQAIVG